MDTLSRSELLEELRMANEESARLTEMIALLKTDLDDARLVQLRVELLCATKRALRLAEELASDQLRPNSGTIIAA